MAISHEPVMELIRTSMNPESRAAPRPVDSPAGRVASAAARADADENGTDRIVLLASGTTATATWLALVLADATEQTVDTAAVRNAQRTTWTDCVGAPFRRLCRSLLTRQAFDARLA
ncbi:hypothetical protein [Streptomyces sp. NPDC001492]